MRVQPILLIALVVATLLWPTPALAKRRAPNPVPPVVWEGVEYRAPLDVEHMGYVQAFDVTSGRKLWETKVYHVWIIPMLEEDVQWVFISFMEVRDGKLLVKNENGKSFRLDLKTGTVEGGSLVWFASGLLIVAVFLVVIRTRGGQGKQMT